MLSIITPAYNNPDEVKKLLLSIRPEKAKDPGLEVIVVDDCSRDDSIKRVVQESGFATFVRLDKNSGPAEARNVGARLAKNEILLFVDSDVVLNSDTISKIKDKFINDDSVKIYCGEYDVEPANPSLSTRFKSLMVRSWAPREDFVTDFLTRVGAIKKSVFDEFGGFDTSLRTASVEDYDLARRLMKKGYVIHYNPDITVKHHFPPFNKQIELFFHRAFTWIYVFKKHGRFDNTCTTPLQGISQVCGFLASIFLFAAPLNIGFLYLSLLSLILFILTSGRFFKLTLRHEGALFALKSLFMALVLSWSIVLGALSGMVYYFLYCGMLKKDKRYEDLPA